jgi:hypothetical protein
MFLIAILGLLLLLLTPAITRAQQLEHESQVFPIVPGKLPVQSIATKDSYFKEAYGDVFKILSEPNTCSDFYGGPRGATIVLNDFIKTVHGKSMPQGLTFEMNGITVFAHDVGSGASYRLFPKVIVNTEGAFYQRRTSFSQRLPRSIGEFGPGSRPARALILMHELAHLIKSKDGAWLIPDDGGDPYKSRDNTVRVQRACLAQLKALN